jgi:RNA polymerase sigma-70 factor, ECF subfamily
METQYDQETLTLLLKSAGDGDQTASDKLFDLAYQELKIMAHQKLLGFGNMETMHTTALVHEAYIKLFNHGKLNFENRNHFFALCAKMMRQILVDHYRKKSAEKRGGGRHNETLGTHHGATEPSTGEELLDLDSALGKLSTLNDRLSTVVECKFFISMKDEEIASYLGVTDRTIRNDWRKAKMWLSKELMRQNKNPGILE